MCNHPKTFDNTEIRPAALIRQYASACLALLLVMPHASYAGNATPTSTAASPVGLSLTDLIDNWVDRSQRFRTIALEWEGHITYAEGSLFWSPSKVATARAANATLPQVPSADSTFRMRGTIAWDRAHDRLKLSHDPPTWNSEEGVHFQQTMTYAMSPNTVSSFLGASQGAPFQLRGYIRDRGDKDSLPGNVDIPLLVKAFFPHGEPLSPIKPDREWEMLGEQTVVNGHACVPYWLERVR